MLIYDHVVDVVVVVPSMEWCSKIDLHDNNFYACARITYLLLMSESKS